jgi:thiol-disulfide isomerase/thioredoxin
MTPNRKYRGRWLTMALFIAVLFAAVLIISGVRKGPSIANANTAYAAGDGASGPLRALFEAPQWLNTKPLHAEDIRGKVVLVNFWTYSCINCLRILPHVRAWAQKYHSRGLAVIGVHTPEFAFEKDVGNVSKALVSLGVSYPIAIDNDYLIWRAFNNSAWPALYFIGADGRIRRHVLGEGEYEQSEQLIQQLLSEADAAHIAGGTVTVSGISTEAAPDERDLHSPETYIGYTQATNFDSPGFVSENVSKAYKTLSALPLNRWSLSGVWTIAGEYAVLNEAPGRIAYRFHARDLHLVLARSSQGHPIRFRVTIDGNPPGADHGYDIDADGWGTLEDDRLYQLVRQAGRVVDRTFEIEFFESSVRAYAFTFG